MYRLGNRHRLQGSTCREISVFTGFVAGPLVSVLSPLGVGVGVCVCFPFDPAGVSHVIPLECL